MKRILILSSLLSFMGFNATAEGIKDIDRKAFSRLITNPDIQLVDCDYVGIVEGCQAHRDGFSPEHLCGGYTQQRDLSEEDMTLFHKVLGDAIFTPLSVSTQVVAGLNYCFRCRYDDGTENSPCHCFVTIYQPLQGESVLSAIQDENTGPEMKVIIDNEGLVGRYIDEDETSYHGEIQDDYRVEKSYAHTDVVKACEGQGILTLKEPGRQSVVNLPDANSDTLGTMTHEEGFIPETYRCLGYIRGWFLVEVDGKSGFIREDLVNWDAINTF